MNIFKYFYQILFILIVSELSYANKESILKSDFNFNIMDFLPNIINFIIGQNHTTKISSKCISDFKDFFRDIQRLEPWALAMLDSNSKFHESFINMLFNHGGDMQECLLVDELSNNKYKGHHCILRLSLNSILNIINYDIEVFSSWTWFNIGICIPASCTVHDLRKLIDWHLNKYNVSSKFFVDGKFCNTSTPLPWRFLDTIGIIFFGIFFIVVICSTYYDLYSQGKKNRNDMYICFSWYTNGKRLLYGTDIEASSRPYDCLHGIRVISMIWIILGHRIMSVIQYPVWNQLSFFYNFEKSLLNIAGCSAPLAVEIFFFMSGFLVGKIFFPIYTTYKRMNYFVYYIIRWVRTTPSLVAQIIFETTFTYHLLNSPYWKGEYDYKLKTCSKNWWTNILYVNNFLDTDDICLLHTWYLAVDFQLYLLAPFVMIPLIKSPKYGEMWANFLLIFGIFLSYYINYINEIPIGLFDIDTSKLEKVNDVEYFPVYARYVPYLMGIQLSWCFFKNKDKKITLNKLQLWTYWTLWFIFFFGSVIAVHPYLQIDYKSSEVKSSAFVALVRPIFISTFCWLIFACSIGYGGFLNTILSCKLFKLLSRLTFGIFLSHVFVQSVTLHSNWGTNYLSRGSLLFSVTGDVIGSVILSSIIYMTFELSFYKMKQTYFLKMFLDKKPIDPEDVLIGKGSAQL